MCSTALQPFPTVKKLPLPTAQTKTKAKPDQKILFLESETNGLLKIFPITIFHI